MSQRLVRFACVAIGLISVACGPSGPPVAEITRYDLPASVSFPEGVAFDAAAGALYTASAVDGTIVRIKVATRTSEPVAGAGTLLPAGNTTFPGVLGMTLDASKRLWIAGGRTGNLWVVDSATGRVLKQVQVPDPSRSLINDVALVGTTGYFTDTFVPTLWRLEAKGDEIGTVEPWLDFSQTALHYDEGPNLNGIVATPDGGSLFVAQMNKGLLFRIDTATKAVSAIDTGGADLTGADGLVLDGNRLYVVRQTAGEIVALDLSEDATKATVVSRFTDPQLAWPATAVKVGTDLVVVNSQFNARDGSAEKRPFALLSVPVSRLGGS